MSSYIGVIHRKEAGIFSVGFPDFPNCVSAGRSFEEAYGMAKDVLGEHIRLKKADGESLPKASTMREILANPAFSEGVAYISIEAETPARVVRISVTMDESLLAKIDAAAKNRSGFLAEAARHYLRLTS